MASLASFFIKNSEDVCSKKDAMVIGKHYRFTVLTERLIRLEYSKDGIFEDRASSLVVFRNFEKPLYQVSQNASTLTIVTKYFTLEYQKEKSFLGNPFLKGNHLKVFLNDSNKVWYYTHPEVRNFGGSNVSLDDYQKGDKISNGLFSTDGFATIDDSSSLVLDQDRYVERTHKENIDLYLFMYRKDFGLCLRDYFRLTGYPSMIPRYALGVWWYKNERYHEEELQNLVQNFENLGIPLSILLLGEKWSDPASNYSFHPNLFPNIPQFISYLHKKNIKLALSVDPGKGITSRDEKIGEVKKILGIDNNKKIEFLPFNDLKLGIYFNYYIRPLEDKGVDFFYLNMNNKTSLKDLWLLDHYHFTDSSKTPLKRGLILSRNSKMASHRYPILFSGKTKVDWDTLNFLPFYNSTSSNIGLSFWAHAIGGFYGGIEDDELYLRYVELGTFSPIFILSSDGGKYYKREPWKWNPKISKIVCEYMQLRNRLIPYLYSESYIYHKTGSPFIKPLYYTYPEIYDEPAYRNEYLFGSQMLVCPITKKKDVLMDRAIVKIFIPKGTWYDFTTGKKYPGGKYYVSFYRDEDYPVFCKAGSIVPLSNDPTTAAPVNLEIYVFPGKSSSYKFYEDDGVSNLYQNGYYLLSQIDYHYQEDLYVLTIRPLEGKTNIIPEYRNYKIRFRNTKKFDKISIYANDEIVHYISYMDKNDFVIEIKNVKSTSILNLNGQGKNLISDTTRLIKEEIEGILSDLEIETSLKENLDEILFGDLSIKQKRIEVKKLKRKHLEDKFIKMFIKLLEYMDEI